MAKKIIAAPKSAYTKRFEEISKLYPPEDVKMYLRMQRRWVRRVTQMTHISPIQRLVILFVGTFCTPDKPFCFAGMKYICDHVDCERTTAHRAIMAAEKIGYLTVDRRKRGGNVYRIQIPI